VAPFGGTGLFMIPGPSRNIGWSFVPDTRLIRPKGGARLWGYPSVYSGVQGKAAKELGISVRTLKRYVAGALNRGL